MVKRETHQRDLLPQHKPAIAMIELIFALVIMGIVLMSAPLLIQQSIRSGNVALQQEAIAAAASQTSIILSMHWDEQNSNLPIGTSPLLDTNRAPFDFNLTSLPAGLVGVSGRNIEDNNATLPPTAFSDFGPDESNLSDTNESDYSKFDDVDDYQNSTFGLMVFNTESTTTDIGDYIDVNITMKTTINYTEDRPNSMSTTPLDILGPTIAMGHFINHTPLDGGVSMSNIKFITVNLSSNSGIKELEKNITMEAFSCNIGTTLPEGEKEL